MPPRHHPPRLAVYGSLAPGEQHHEEIAHLAGSWQPGSVMGRLVDRGWGDRLGYPGFIPDPLGAEVAVMVFTSPDLDTAWAQLDEFEGAEYRRTVVAARLATGATVDVCIYALR